MIASAASMPANPRPLQLHNLLGATRAAIAQIGVEKSQKKMAFMAAEVATAAFCGEGGTGKAKTEMEPIPAAKKALTPSLEPSSKWKL